MTSLLVASLIASAAFAGPEQSGQQSLLRQVIPSPTGNNGYEEYLMACDIVRTSRVREIVDGSPEHYNKVISRYSAKAPANSSAEERQMFELERPTPEEYQLALKYRTYSVLQLRKEALTRAGKALDLLARGNKKKVFDPRTSMDFETLFPEYAYLRTLGKLAAAGAYVAYAEGQPARGTQYLCDAIILGQNLSDGVLIARLVGVAIQSAAFAAFEKFLPNLSATDAALLESLAPKLLENPPAAVKTIAKEYAFMENSLEKLFNRKDPEEDLYGDIEEKSAASKSAEAYLKKLTPAEQRQMIEIVRKKMARQRETLLAGYRRPESEWDQEVTNEEEFSPQRTVRSVADLADYFGDQLTPVFSQIGNVEIRNRTQIRLLALAGSIIKFKWEYDRWPIKLSEAAGRNGVFDPASGEEFIFEIEGTGFRVYSRGSKTTGEIALRYKKPSADPNSAPPPLRN